MLSQKKIIALKHLHSLKKSPLWRKRMTEVHKGKKLSPEHIETIRKAHIGKIVSKETREKKRLSMIGKNIGQTRSLEMRKRYSQSKKGIKNPMWKGGISPERVRIWHSLEYKLWREAVFKRDDFKCTWCNKIGGTLNADHIQLFSERPDLRFAIDNGRTLCKSCHDKRHSKNSLI
jgi:5-methylcytosine-specific restriction enzyme A